ncbi:MAG: 16S rRNA (cytosine(1402)-N(4))-methyltransferase RsmH [Candidatus Omnitrophica bacterium]|nr:16S rRNA (cytosine(1402)-N(4))-methyltransferase RsmH [Candidatus Omnitrophota bacterium]
MGEKCLHNPVLLEEVLHFLNPAPGKIIIDATVGGGGHAEEIVRRICPGGTLIGMDRDSESLRIAHERLKGFQTTVKLVNKNFKDIKETMLDLGTGEVDGILFDLGISSIQLEAKERGFSIKHDGPLDMRMDRNQRLTAKDLVNKLSETELSSLIKEFGEERFNKRIAWRIVTERKKRPIENTTELAGIVSRSMPCGKRRQKIHPATRTFQALRIRVNSELIAIEEALNAVPDLLKPGGRVCVISFHSLEDRIVKNVLKKFKSQGVFRILTKKPVTAGVAELSQNPRARSSKLRAAAKI